MKKIHLTILLTLFTTQAHAQMYCFDDGWGNTTCYDVETNTQSLLNSDGEGNIFGFNSDGDGISCFTDTYGVTLCY